MSTACAQYLVTARAGTGSAASHAARTPLLLPSGSTFSTITLRHSLLASTPFGSVKPLGIEVQTDAVTPGANDYAVRVEWLGHGIYANKGHPAEIEAVQLAHAFVRVLTEEGRALKTKALEISAACRRGGGARTAAAAILGAALR